jgi:hypothetical protein
MNAPRISLVALVALAAAGCSSSPSVRTVSRAAPPTAPVTAGFVFGSNDVAVVRAHYASSGPGNGQGKGRGNGRGRNGGLPPGIAKNLERGKPLPPGIAKQYLPASVLVELPRPADGLEYVVVAGKLLLVHVATQVVHDILVDVLF